MAERKLESLDQIITVNPKQCGGVPCVRGLRIRVTDVLDLLANGMSVSEILDEHPDLTAQDVSACIKYAAEKINHPRLSVR